MCLRLGCSVFVVQHGDNLLAPPLPIAQIVPRVFDNICLRHKPWEKQKQNETAMTRSILCPSVPNLCPKCSHRAAVPAGVYRLTAG